ncbi:hypothetical protein O6H91_13G068300 [Diphasiastrum complanatum]|uniref:Uncharacterized protein n=1 Tax=Diphasiastrum complanatum TaxID=34168 RepID=A0ACC2BWV2_DIPCM|nr:hypothetical protein O6H91_13G068300 [Diphasiastrum complanatum]
MAFEAAAQFFLFILIIILIRESFTSALSTDEPVNSEETSSNLDSCISLTADSCAYSVGFDFQSGSVGAGIAKQLSIAPGADSCYECYYYSKFLDYMEAFHLFAFSGKFETQISRKQSISRHFLSALSRLQLSY